MHFKCARDACTMQSCNSRGGEAAAGVLAFCRYLSVGIRGIAAAPAELPPAGRLRPRMGEIRQLRDQVIGAPLRNLRKEPAPTGTPFPPPPHGVRRGRARPGRVRLELPDGLPRPPAQDAGHFGLELDADRLRVVSTFNDGSQGADPESRSWSE
jgi:hypothetical protein